MIAHFGHSLLSLATLLFLEIILGIDNLIFVSVASQSLPKHQQSKARKFGLLLALFTRLLLLGSMNYLAQFTTPLFTLFDIAISGRDILLTAGGLFLLYKGTDEIHGEFQSKEEKERRIAKTFIKVIIQIAILDIVFSFDSVITAIGMTQQFFIMALAIVLAIIFMIFAANPLSDFIEKNPSVKMLALSFILMVGMILIADGFHFHVPRAYIYFAIAFSLFVEFMNILTGKRSTDK
jgi:predicted tellurium resistance membrane protein TerC